MGGLLRTGVVLATGVAAFAFAGPAAAETYEVAITTDTVVATSEGHSLRSAIIAANANPGRDTIVVPSGLYALSIEGRDEDAAQTGDLDVTDDVTIDGAGSMAATVDGSALDRVFHVVMPLDSLFLPQVTIEGLRITNGSVVPSVDFSFDGGGAIKSDGALTLTDVLLDANAATSDGRQPVGGGLYATGPTTITDSLFVGNQATNSEGSALGGGLAVFANGVVELAIESSTFVGNRAVGNLCGQGAGGAIYLSNAVHTTITKSVVGAGEAGNEAHGSCQRFGDVPFDEGSGGGIYNATSGGDEERPAALVLVDTDVAHNRALEGGGIYSPGSLTLSEGSSVTSNLAVGANGESPRGGGIYTSADRDAGLVVFDSAIRSNVVRADHVDGEAQGGGIYNSNGNVDLTNAEVVDNQALAENGDSHGGGIMSDTFGCFGECDDPGRVFVTDSLIAGNSAGEGGGVRLRGGGDFGYQQGVFATTLITENSAERGGGVYVRGDVRGTSTVFLRSTVADNSANHRGGGIYAAEEALELTRTTVSGNLVTGDTAAEGAAAGGGVFLLGSDDPETAGGDLSLQHSTVSGNSAVVGGGIASFADEDDGVVGVAPDLDLRESTFAENEGEDGSALYNGGDAQAFSTIFSGSGVICAGADLSSSGYNLDQGGGTCGLHRETDFLAEDPQLGELADNGGPTQTHLPGEGSPVIDHVPDCGGTDQRGVSRPQGQHCDIGSVEVEQEGGGGPANFVVDDDRVQCPDAAFTSIQSAVDAADAGQTITVCAGTYPGASVTKALTLQGPGSDPRQSCLEWGPADATRDAIVGGGATGLSLEAAGVVVDGFVVQGSTTGIRTSSLFGAYTISDNVVAGNVFGIALGASGEGETTVAQNCFTGNTRAAVHGLDLANASIDANAFSVPDQGGAESWGVFLGQIECCNTQPRVDGVGVNNNVATAPGLGTSRFVELSRTNDVMVAANTSTGFDSTHLFLANGNVGTQVLSNTFADGRDQGIWISDIGFVGGFTNTGLTISGNEIRGMGVYGIGVEAGSSLQGSTISGNQISGSGRDGIGFQPGGNVGNTIAGNALAGSDEHDCHDDTTGSGTAGTGNTWADNSGSTSQPAGLCGPNELTISDASAGEGDAATFTVTLHRARSMAIMVDYATANGTAGSSDYTTQSGTLTFAPGELTKTITVPTTEDSLDEPDETFTVTLSNPQNVLLGDGQATGTISDDDEPAPTPAISISDSSVTEGDTGTTEMTFTLTRSSGTGESRVDFDTDDGTATGEVDYDPTSGTVVFGAGETQKTIAVQVRGDLLVEPNETLFVDLSNPQNATIADGRGQGTIVDDDAPADLSVDKTDSPDPATVGRDLTYTVSVKNEGLGPANDVVLTDTLPPGVFFTFASSSQGTCTFVAPQVVCTIGTLGSQAMALVTIVIQPISTGTLTNSATATTSSTDANAQNNTDTTTTTVNAAPQPPPVQAKLDVIKTDAVDPVAVGQRIEYLITIDNDGDGSAADVRLDDSLTDGVQFVSATPSQGTCSNAGSNVQCQLGTIAAGASAEVTLVVRALRSGTVTNTARATTTSPANEDLNSDFEQTTVNPAAGDLVIEKDVFTPLERAAKEEQRTEEDRPGAGAVGLDLTYVLTAANEGPSPVAGVTVEDQLPKNLTLKAVRASRGTCTIGPFRTFIRCELGELDAGEFASITIIVRPQRAGRYTNTARIEGDAPDPVLVNNRARVETVVVAQLPRIPIFRPACQFRGDDRANQFRGGPRHEVFCGYGGRDDIDAGRGNDVVFGGFGDDIVRVDLGLDYLDGEEGDDRIHAADGRVDVVIGGIGIDYVIVDRFDFVVGAEYVCIQNARRNCT
jgi:uncharacterized repeat protein (TIGR01451 family)